MTALFRLSLFLALLIPASGAIPPLSPPLSSNEYSHRVWRIEDGLPQNRIRALAQTPDGYLWIGTSEGLSRFDGVRFTVFDHSNTPALHDDGILQLRLTHDGALWIGTEGGGLVRYHRGVFTNFAANEGITNGFVRAIFEDSRRTLWVGTDRGFFRRVGERFTRLDGTAAIPLATVGSIGEDENGRVWAASQSRLLTVVDDKLVSPPADCTALTVRIRIKNINGSLWGFGPAGVSRIHNGCQVKTDLPAVPTNAATIDSNGNFWLGTFGHGVIRSAGGKQATFSTAAVNALFEDREQNIWIGSEDGLVRLSRNSGTNIGASEGLDDDDVLTAYSDRGGNLWLATLTGQVYRIAGTSVKRYRLPAPAQDVRVRSVFQDSAGSYWFGTLADGIVHQTGNTATVYTRANGLRSNTVRQILEDRAGAIWIALESGLSRWDGHTFRNYYLDDGLSYPSTRCMLADDNGDILVGTDSGLNRIHDGNIVRDAEFASLAKEKIWAIYRDTSGTLWLGTRGGGLVRFRSGKITRFTKDNGLPSDSIFGILEDKAGKLWLSTSSGIVSSDHSGEVIHVVAAGQMNGGVQPAGAITPSGDLWFPSVKGAVRLSSAANPVRHTGSVLIEKAAVAPGHGRLEFDFTLCDLTSPEHVSFRYRLERFEDNWTPALRTRSAGYTNVPPGKYIFHVIASDASSANMSEVSLPVSLPPAFYQTNWFYAALALAAAAAVWAGFALYARQTRARYAVLLAERTRLAREMHDTVIQGCVGVATLLEASAGFRNVDAAAADRYLDDARSQVTETLDEARQAVWDLRHQVADESSIDLLFDLARKLGNEHGIRIETQKSGKAALDPDTDRTMLLVGREALRNAVAHADAKSISLRITSGPSEVCLEVADDGSGIGNGNGGDGRHFGIIGMRERVEGSGGSFSIVSGRGAGTKVVARMPLH